MIIFCFEIAKKHQMETKFRDDNELVTAVCDSGYYWNIEKQVVYVEKEIFASILISSFHA